jgi:hypothetical protein
MSARPPARSLFLPALFACAIFTSATLLFLVQPMVAKMMLPLFGGAASVWNTCLVFYQSVLLLGYLYAHASSRKWSLGRQVLAHGALLVGVAWLLPIGLSHTAAPLDDDSPTPAVLLRLATTVGPPFFALSATGTLLQSWFARSGHLSGRDPYFLYAASNLGSMLALLAYPSLLEPNVGLANQSRLWAAGFFVLIAFVLTCGWLVWGGRAPARAEAAVIAASPCTLRQRLVWVGVAFVPSSLMMGVTLYLTTDIAPVPLLWIVPLALYLLAFILAFARLPALVVRGAGVLAAPAVIVLLFFILSEMRYPTEAAIALHLGALFLVSVAYLGKLAATRPAPEHLTEFYLWVSFGGVLGGVFNVLMAPLLFQTVAEYPLMLILAVVLLRPVHRLGGEATEEAAPARSRRIPALLLDAGLAALVGLLCFWFVTRHPVREVDLTALGHLFGFPRWRISTAVTYALPIALCLALHALKRTVAFALALAAVAAVCTWDNENTRNVVYRDRSFFGVLAVSDDKERDCRHIWSGKTPHGRQFLDPERRGMPLAFYHRYGPIGAVFREFAGPKRKENVAIIGLGAGALATYGEPGQRMTFYEIDPGVVAIAENPRLFTYMSDSKATLDVVLGDARLKLAHAPSGHYGIVVVDAFSSDAIPVHLLTREALALYLDKLTPDGVLAMHISNRYLDLSGVIARLAEHAGLHVRVQTFEARDGCMYFFTRWMILARDERHFGHLAASPAWRKVPIPPGTPFWTDDFSNLIGVFSFQ